MASLQPDLLPSLADLLQALRFAVVAGLTCGLGFLAGARRPETALFTGWGIACLTFVVFGCLSQLALVVPAILLAAAGAAGLLLRFRRGQGGTEGEMAWRVLVLAAPMLAILLSLRTTAYDDFSFWAPNLVALCQTGHFPLAAQPLAASFMPAYPRGIALSGYATWLLAPDPSPAGILRLLATGAWWNMLAMLAVAAALANNLAIRLQPTGRGAAWGLAALAILLQSFLNPGFISKMSLSNMGDGATGSGLAMLTALVFELPGTGRNARRVILEMAFTAAAVVFIRQDNFALLFIWAAGAALGLWLWRPWPRRRMFWLPVAAVPTLLTWLVWTHYAAAQIPGGAHSLLPIRDWHWADYPATLHAADRVLLSKGVYTLLALGFCICFLRMLAGLGPTGIAEKLALTATTILILGNAAFILFTYLATSFTQIEVRTAVTFWRFLAQTAPAEMVTLACLVPRAGITWPRLGWTAIPLCLVTALLPAGLLATPFTFRTDLRSPVPAFLSLGQTLAPLLAPGSPLLLLDNSDGSGYAAWIIKFGLLELGHGQTPVTISLAPQLSPAQPIPIAALPPGAYVVVTQSQWRPAYFRNANMQPWHAYLFKRGASGLALLQHWPFPRYGKQY